MHDGGISSPTRRECDVITDIIIIIYVFINVTGIISSFFDLLHGVECRPERERKREAKKTT